MAIQRVYRIGVDVGKKSKDQLYLERLLTGVKVEQTQTVSSFVSQAISEGNRGTV